MSTHHTPTRRIALIRHPVTAVGSGICYGRSDVALAAGAEARIAAIVAQTRGLRPAVIWTSPARRCRLTAAAVAAAHDARLVADERLVELDFGAWEGRPWTAVPRSALDQWASDPMGFAAPGGETVTALLLRVRSFLADLAVRGGDQVVVTHGGPLRALIPLLRGQSPDPLAPPPNLGSVTLLAVPVIHPEHLP